VGDEIFWTVIRENADPAAGPERTEAPQLGRIAALDALTVYNPYEPAFTRHAGHAAGSTFVADVAGLYARYRTAVGAAPPLVPVVIPGFNDRAVRPAADHYVIARTWRQRSNRTLLAELFERLVWPFVDADLAMVMITSWDEWNEDTAIEPVREAAPTSRDDSPTGRAFTQDYAYVGYGTRYLEVVRDAVAAVSGRVTARTGNPLAGVRVLGWQDGVVVAATRTNREGRYTLSRRTVRPGTLVVGLDADRTRTVSVRPDRTRTNVDLMAGER